MKDEHGLGELKEEVIVPKKREEAKSRYQTFQELTTTPRGTSSHVCNITTIKAGLLPRGILGWLNGGSLSRRRLILA